MPNHWLSQYESINIKFLSVDVYADHVTAEISLTDGSWIIQRKVNIVNGQIQDWMPVGQYVNKEWKNVKINVEPITLPDSRVERHDVFEDLKC